MKDWVSLTSLAAEAIPKALVSLLTWPGALVLGGAHPWKLPIDCAS